MDPILLVDDEKDNLEALQRLLRTSYKVATANSPFEALKLVQTNQFHVIVSDQRMPEMSGVELLEKVKKLSPSTTRILLTGYTDIESVIDAINRGNIYRYVAKPWDPEDLRLTLRQANEAYLLKRELEEKNEALTKKNEELNKALEDLTVLDRAKAKFLSLISHELNTPLTVMTSFIDLLADKKNNLPPEVQKAVQSLNSASQRFSEIVTEGLTYVKLQSDNVLHPGSFGMKKETEALISTMSPEFKKKNLTVNVSGDDALVKADPEKMRLVLRHLLRDAAVHSSHGTTIDVTIIIEEAHMAYRISRGGAGMVGDPFQAFEPSGNEMHHQRDLGLSLAICKLIIEAHGGTIAIESRENPTRLVLKLPEAQG